MPRDPKFSHTAPKFCGEFESEVRSRLQEQNGGDNSPFRGARPKLTSYSDSNPTPHISWYPRVFWGRFTEPNSISAWAGVRITF